MKYAIGQSIVYTAETHTTKGLRKGTITKVGSLYGESVVWINHQHKPEDCIMVAYVYPVEYEAELVEILNKRSALKKAFDDSLGLIFELKNKITRENS